MTFSIGSMLFCRPPKPKAATKHTNLIQVPTHKPLFNKGPIGYPSGRTNWFGGQSEQIYYKAYIVDVYPEKGKWIYVLEIGDGDHEESYTKYAFEESELREYK